jgi:hypothetical protein
MSTMTQDNLEGQRALVTGATSGIGRAVALQLARDGAEVLVHGRDAARGAETVHEITAAGGKATFLAADLGDVADVQRLASDVGEVDILINNAGVALFASTAEFDVQARSSSPRSEKRPPCTAPHSPRRSPRSSPSSPPHERATSPAPPSPPTADAERSSPNHSRSSARDAHPPPRRLRRALQRHARMTTRASHQAWGS